MKKTIGFFTAVCLLICGCGAEETFYETVSGETAELLSEQAFSSSGEDGNAEESTEDTAGITVYVCGAVRRPGVYRLASGARIYEAVDMAGGMLPEADERAVNLAALLTDAQMIVIPYAGEDNYEPQEDDGRVNINTAGTEELMMLPGIGRAKAAAIIADRESNGPFQEPRDIMRVSGIKEAVFEKIKAYIRTE